MKKILSIALIALMLAAMFTFGASAADIDRTIVYQAAYGTPVIDGKMDDIYLLSDEMYAENGAFASSASVKEGQYATAKYRLVWNQTSLYIYCEVTDPTRSDPGAFNASASKMDNTDIYVLCDPNFSIEKDYSDRSPENSGQFRYNPNCTIDEEPARAASWGGLTILNQLFNTLNYVGGYKTENGGDYYFEMKFDFNEAYQKTLAENISTKTDTLLGFAIQVNDVMDNDAKRDALVYSNNANGALSTNLKNCGVVSLFLQAGADVTPVETTPAETTPEQPPETTPEETTPTETTPAETAPPETTPAKPAETTPKSSDTSKADDNKGGCGSSVAVGLVAVLACACLPVIRRRRED